MPLGVWGQHPFRSLFRWLSSTRGTSARIETPTPHESPSVHLLPRILPAAALTLAAVFAVSGCTATPAPTATDAPSPLTFVVITPAPTSSDPFLEQAVASTRAVATDLGATVEVLESADATAVSANVESALASSPDLIIGLTDQVLYDFDPAAASNLDQQFLLVDASAAEPTSNLTAVMFRDFEATYLTGVEAALLAGSGSADDTGAAIGVVAPEEDPLVQSWIDTFAAGVAEVSPSAAPTVAVIGGDRPTANVEGAAATAAGLASDGARYLQAVELAPGVNLLDAASDGDFATFGTQVDQCALAPGHVVDSTIKRVDVALEAALPAVLSGETGGVYSYGVAEGGVTLAALDDGAAASGCLIVDHPDLLAQVAEARDRIADGTTAVPDPLYVTLAPR